MICPHCRKQVEGYDPDEEPTGRSGVAMRLYRLWIGAFDGFTIEQAKAVLEVLAVIKSLTPDRFRKLTDAITGPGLGRAFLANEKRTFKS